MLPAQVLLCLQTQLRGAGLQQGLWLERKKKKNQSLQSSMAMSGVVCRVLVLPSLARQSVWMALVEEERQGCRNSANSPSSHGVWAGTTNSTVSRTEPGV